MTSSTGADLDEPEFTPRNLGMVFACMVGAGCGVGALPFYTLGVFVLPLQAALDASRAEVQSVWFFVSLIGAIMSPMVGVAVDRFGAKWVGISGLAGLGFGLACLGYFATSLLSLYVLAASFTVLGAGTSPVTWTRAVNTVFTKNRGLALGLTLSGTGVAAALAPSYAAHMVELYGWQLAYGALGLLPLCLALPCVILGLPRSAQVSNRAGNHPNQTLSWVDVFRDRRFLLLLFGFMSVSLGIGGLIVNYVPLLVDGGYESTDAARFAGLIGISVIIGRVSTGLLVDRLWPPGVACTILMLPALSCVLLLQLSPDNGLSDVWVSLAAVLIGLAAGAEFDLIAFLIPRYYRLQHYGKLYGVQFGAISLTAGSAPLLFALCYDRTGTYRIALISAAVLFVCGAASLLLLDRGTSQPAQPLEPSS